MRFEKGVFGFTNYERTKIIVIVVGTLVEALRTRNFLVEITRAGTMILVYAIHVM
jgi:hypothetical protein